MVRRRWALLSLAGLIGGVEVSGRYVPCLTVTRSARVRRTRRLPMDGVVLCTKGDSVKAEDVIATAELPGRMVPINLARAIGVPPRDLARHLEVEPGSKVVEGQVLAERKGFLDVFSARAVSPMTGLLKSVSPLTGQAVVQAEPVPLELLAFISGVVVEVIEAKGALIEGEVGLVQGVFGLGGETFGELFQAVDEPDRFLDQDKAADLSRNGVDGKVIVAGSGLSLGAFRELDQAGAAAVVTGGFGFQEVLALSSGQWESSLGSRGSDGAVLVVTEGFGIVPMAERTFDVLAGFEGKRVSVSGVTQVRAGVIRPEILIPEPGTRAEPESLEPVLEPGAMVRAVSGPRFGKMGVVESLPEQPMAVETGAMVRAAVVRFEDKEQPVVVPRANLELISSTRPDSEHA